MTERSSLREMGKLFIIDIVFCKLRYFHSVIFNFASSGLSKELCSVLNFHYLNLPFDKLAKSVKMKRNIPILQYSIIHSVVLYDLIWVDTYYTISMMELICVRKITKHFLIFFFFMKTRVIFWQGSIVSG